MDIPTIRIHHEGLPGGLVINVADFDPAVHTPFDQAAPAGVDPRAAREKELASMPAADVKALAGVDVKTKAEAVEAVLAKEFPATG